MAKPNFVGVGVIKCGTTWVADVLASHPDVFVAHGKEIHFFSEFHERGIPWYLRHFDGAGDESAVGEYSVSYMDDAEKNAERIRHFDPGMKLIVTLRNPVERAFSHYRWLKQFGHEFDSFEAALARHPSLISNGLYHASMQAYWNRFPDRQIHYILHDDIRNDPEAVQEKLFEFLGVDVHFQSRLSGEVVGKTIVPRSRKLEFARPKAHAFMVRYRLAGVITAYKKLGISSLYRRINDRPEEQEVISDATRDRLLQQFAPDIHSFGQRTGIDLSRWLDL